MKSRKTTLMRNNFCEISLVIVSEFHSTCNDPRKNFFLFSKGIAEIWFKTQKANKARTCFFFAIDVNCYWVFMEPNDGQ